MPHKKLPLAAVLSAGLLLASAFFAQRSIAGDAGYFAGGNVHVISSSHQDIGWMDTPQRCIEARDSLVITPALERMKENKDFKFVAEDVMMLMEYLERHPDRKAEIQRFGREGRLEWGATYNQPYESMYDGEALVRQVYLGRKYLKRTLPGVDSHVYWNVDVPGRAMQMPQILKKADIRYLIMSRHEKGFYDWRSPDGSGVLAWSPGHYHSSGEIFRAAREVGADHTTIIERHRDISEIKTMLTDILANDADYYRSRSIPPQYGITFSTDFSGPARLDDLFRQWNTTIAPSAKLPTLQYATGESFLDAVLKQGARFDTIVGERPEVWLYIHGATHEYALTAGREAWRLLTAAEKFAAIDAVLSGSMNSYPQETFFKAWAEAIFPDHGWGGYNGDITDRLFRTKMEAGRDKARDILERSEHSIASRIALKQGFVPIVVFNNLSWPVTGPVETEIDVYGRPFTGLRIVDALGDDVPFQIVAGDGSSVRPADEALKIVFIARDVPSVGYKTFYAVRDESAVYPASKPDASSSGVIENKYYRVELASGGVKRLFDRQENRDVFESSSFLGGEFFTLKSEGNGAGEFAEVQQPTLEGFARMSGYEPRWSTVESGPVRTVMEYTRRFDHCTARERIIIYNDIKRIDFEADILGFDGTKSREYRLAFPLAMKNAEIAYDVPMGVAVVGKSEIAGAAGERYTQNCAEVHPREVQDWFGASDGTFGVTVASCVSMFDWVSPLETSSKSPILQPVLLASRRSCHGEGNWYLQAGDHSYAFSLTSYKGDWKNGYRSGMEARRPLSAVIVRESSTAPCLPETMSFCSVDRDNVIVSAIKKSDDDNRIVVRCYEVEGKPVDAAVTWFTSIDKPENTNIIEENGAPGRSDGRSIRIKAGANAIETAAFMSGAWSAKASEITPPSDPVFSPKPGVYIESSKTITLTAEPTGVEIRYTTDGSEPTRDSALYTNAVKLNRTTVLKARAFLPGRSAGRTVTAEYRIGLNPAVTVKNPVKGIGYTLYHGSWELVPDYDRITAVATGVTDSIGFHVSDIDDGFGIRFTGYVRVPKDGVYTFYTKTDDGSRMYIDGTEVVTNDGRHEAIVREGTLALKKGYHALLLDYMESGGGQALEAGWEGPDMKRQAFTPGTLYVDKK